MSLDDLCDQFNDGRRDMIDAFARISTIARRAGAITEDQILELHRQFFDGNVATKEAFNIMGTLARIWEPPTRP